MNTNNSITNNFSADFRPTVDFQLMGNTKYNYKIVHSARSFSPINLQKIVPYLIDMQQFFLSSWQKIKSHLWTIL
jgi:hypothetical protein